MEQEKAELQWNWGHGGTSATLDSLPNVRRWDTDESLVLCALESGNS